MFKLVIVLIVGLTISAQTNEVKSEGRININDGSWGGTPCIVCVYFVGMSEQLTTVYNQTVDKSLEKFCNFLPEGLFRSTCQNVVETYGEVIINGIYSRETPDVICNLLNFCQTNTTQLQCNLYPLPKNIISVSHGAQRLAKKLKAKKIHVPKAPIKICTEPIFRSICQYIEYVFTFRDPALDLDGDGHSEYESLRGSSWKGKDCNDYDYNIRPGRQPTGSDLLFDTNCNGIYGRDIQTAQSYEDKFCKNSSQKGIAVLGDSISAHFHLPEQWFDAEAINEASFTDLAFILENEIDWPELSAMTGYMNSTWFVTPGPTRSIYLNLVQRNRCNFRDYQNVAVNGARTESMKAKFSKSLKRDPKEDQPLLVYYSLVGNDVCNGDADTLNHMTKPADFYNNVVATMKYLDSVLPSGSHVLLTGLANGTVLHDALINRIHPLGRVNSDVTYGDFYTYLTCLGLSPCNGWMTTNVTLSHLTTQHALLLSGIVKNVTETVKFNNFDTAYTEMPFDTIINKWVAMGREIWELIEPIDGFHMNQDANALLADEIWSLLETKYPSWIGNINPFNDEIIKIFGDQNGY